MIDATKLPTVPSDRIPPGDADTAGGTPGATDGSRSIERPAYPSKNIVLQDGRYYATDEKK